VKIDVDKIIAHERRSLAKAITLVESTLASDQLMAQELLQKILPHTGKSFRLGITGVPGVGKSTFIENFGLYLISQGHRVAVLAIDPSSPRSGGSILGDKTRMDKLSQEDNAFIRPTPSLGFLGGVAQATRESILLCEAAGFDFIIIETVGVGQSEFEVADMVDFFLVLMLPNAGDELQGIKKGILELADALAINKADGDNISQATSAMAQYQSALHLTSKSSSWTPQVLTCSALIGTHLDEIYKMLQDYKFDAINSDCFKKKRLNQNNKWFKKLIQNKMQLILDHDNNLLKNKKLLEEKVLREELLPLTAANKYIELVVNHFRAHK
jgi:LAO/AO transport system kinase